MGYAVFVFGPAGVGKSTFCRNVREHGASIGRTYKIINLDPAQICSGEEYSADLRDFITVDEVMEDCDYGPNGGLLAALEELSENIDVLELEELEDSFLLFDCPGQIELFMHSEAIPRIINNIGQYFRCGAVYMMDSQHITDIGKYINGCFCALVSMARICIPFVNVISKTDLVTEEMLEMFYVPTDELYSQIGLGKKGMINRKILDFVVESGMIRFHPLSWNKEDCVEDILYHVESSLQYYEDAEPRTKDFE